MNRNSELKIVIVTHANAEVGYGHLNRCLILGDSLEDAGCQVSLYVIGSVDNISDFIKFRTYIFVCVELPKSFPTADLCLVDLYCYSDEFYRDLRRNFVHIIVFDDYMYKVPSLASGVINCNICADPRRYSVGYKRFVGGKYLLVRPEFWKAKKNATANGVLVCVGGSDPIGIMDSIVEKVLNSSHRIIHAVYGPAFEYPEVIEKWINHPRVITHINPDAISTVYSHCAYAVTGSGSMLYELVSMRIPVISIALAKNQCDLGEYFSNLGSAIYLGELNRDMLNDLDLAVRRLDSNSELLNRMSEACFNAIPESGSRNLAHDLIEWIGIKKDPLKTPYTACDIEEEYDIAAGEKEMHKKHKWGSKESMFNRYELAIRILQFNTKSKWLDVGCGTGLFQLIVNERFPMIICTAIELSSKLIKIAKERHLTKVNFLHCDFSEYTGSKFEIITCLGVMSKSNVDLTSFVEKSAELLEENGELLVDFTNINWDKFNDSGFYPESRHLWFSRDSVINHFQKDKLFTIIACVGYIPGVDQVVDIDQSHTFFVHAKRTSLSCNIK